MNKSSLGSIMVCHNGKGELFVEVVGITGIV